MKKRSIVAIFLLHALFAAVAGIVIGLAAGQSLTPVDTFGVPDALMPGHPMPINATCDWWGYTPGDERYCRVGDVYISYDGTRGEITHTSMYVYAQGVPVGSVIESWGQPTGYAQQYNLLSVHWANRYVYVVGRPFSPAARVALVVWDLDERPATPWRGFINVEDQ